MNGRTSRESGRRTECFVPSSKCALFKFLCEDREVAEPSVKIIEINALFPKPETDVGCSVARNDGQLRMRPTNETRYL
jgi:hypothetical protein